jgi:hypothetical protein
VISTQQAGWIILAVIFLGPLLVAVVVAVPRLPEIILGVLVGGVVVLAVAAAAGFLTG